MRVALIYFSISRRDQPMLTYMGTWTVTGEKERRLSQHDIKDFREEDTLGKEDLKN